MFSLSSVPIDYFRSASAAGRGDLTSVTALWSRSLLLLNGPGDYSACDLTDLETFDNALLLWIERAPPELGAAQLVE